MTHLVGHFLAFVLIMVCGLHTIFAQTQTLHYDGVDPAHVSIPQLFVYGNHWDLGYQIGVNFRKQIQFRVRKLNSIDILTEWVEGSPEGTAAYDSFVRANNDTFPEYFEELKAMAAGAEVSFKDLFLLNLRNEFLNAMDPGGMGKGKRRHLEEEGDEGEGCNDCLVDHCSDYLMMDEAGYPFLGHNEDGDIYSRGTAFFVWGRVEGPDGAVRENSTFLALTYPGELPSNALFVNSHGVACSMNGLYPAETLTGGLGRNFLSRDLLGARDERDALRRLSFPNQSTGHHFNLIFPPGAHGGDWALRSVEVAPAPGGGRAPGCCRSPARLYYANGYQVLEVAECPGRVVSTAHRLAAAARHAVDPGRGWEGVREVLGDASDPEYPIYRTHAGPDSSYTLLTALFRAPEGKLEVLLANPARAEGLRSRFTLDLSPLFEDP
ncbi:unnamed protein product, partial [Heterosigma akashiwo]